MPDILTPRQESILERLQAMVCEQLGVRTEKCVLDANFITDLGCDELDLVELVMGAEDLFDVSIPDEDADQLLTVRAAVMWLDENGAEV